MAGHSKMIASDKRVFTVKMSMVITSVSPYISDLYRFLEGNGNPLAKTARRSRLDGRRRAAPRTPSGGKARRGRNVRQDGILGPPAGVGGVDAVRRVVPSLRSRVFSWA